MSTKAIRELADYVKTHFAPGETLADMALQEVEAIEQAAKALSAQMHPNSKETGLALGLMDNIAKDAP